MFPAILLYPLASQTDLIAQVPLSSNLYEQLSPVLEQHPTWDSLREYSLDTIECLMEIEQETGRGLIKLGKTICIEQAVKGRVVYDGILRFFILPKTGLSAWIAEWKRKNTRAS
jgi:Cns1/TTC4 Wheel domain